MIEQFVYKQREDTFIVKKPKVLPKSPITNESLGAIVAGLEPTENDQILVCCSVADQALALLENAGNVHAFDKRRDQVEYAIYRSMLVREKKFSKFLRKVKGKYYSG